MKKLQIADGELEIMKVLWAEPLLTLPEIVTAVKKKNAWELGTIRTMLSRLIAKEAVEQSGARRSYRYRALVEKDEYAAAAADRFLNSIFGGATRSMLSFFAEHGKITPEDLAELEREIAQNTGDKKK
ncbi:MAG: BlaI/MecI/CopY family transcriptional regulator [Victivallaceae bacterium]|nr:BlaI/MecI/CopY family transcriptional regulator [Victivallaceae bacterium]